jgi:tetratricopeptide (TPR) repeat protein
MESSEIYLDLLEKNPSLYTNAYTLTLLGDRYLSQYKDSLAINSYNRALVYSPDYIPAIIGRAEANRMRGNIPAFFVDAHTFIKEPDVRPSAKSAYINQILKYVDYRFFRSWGAQLDTLVNSCVKTHPTDSSALKLAGSWYYSTERKELGRSYFDRLVKEYPKDLEAHYIRLSLLFDGGNMKDVLDQCNKIIEIGGEKNPKVLPALSTAGDCWHALGNDRKAMKIYDKVLRIDPENVPTLNNYAYYLSLSGKKLKKAEKMSRITIEKEPNNPSYLDTYGWILHLLGRSEEAKPYFKKAMVYGGKDSVEVLEHYSIVLKALGEEELSQYYKSLAENKKAEK